MKTENKLNVFIISALSKDENHYFFVVGIVDEIKFSRLVSLTKNKEYIIILAKESKFDWWAYVWNNQDEEDKVNTYSQYNYSGTKLNDFEIIVRHIN